MIKPFPKVAPESMTARVLLSFLATAGLFYANIMPALIDGLKEALHFTNQEAGRVGAFNMYGGAFGALLIAFAARRIVNWRGAAQRMLFTLVVLDLLSMLVTGPAMLMAVRFVHGAVGGALVGLAFSIFARTAAPDRTFGVLLLVQAGAGGAGVMSLPLLVPMFGTPILFCALILFNVVTLLMLQFLPAYPVVAPKADTGAKKRVLGPLMCALVSVFLFQAGNMGLYAFAIGLGKNAGLDIGFVSETLGLANWVGMFGAVLVVMLSTRFGIFKPILGGMLLTVAGTWALYHSDTRWIWIAANFVGGMTWNFVIAYLLGMCARFDQTGSSAVWAGFASKMGLASGPMIGSFILGENSYTSLINMGVMLFIAATVISAIPAWLLDAGAGTAKAKAVPDPA